MVLLSGAPVSSILGHKRVHTWKQVVMLKGFFFDGAGTEER